MPKATSAPPHAGTTGMSMYIIWCYIELLNHIKCKMSKWSQMHLVLDIRQFACIIVNYGSNMHVWSNYGAFCPCSPVSRNGRTFQLSSSPSHWAIEDNLAAGSVRWRLAKNSTKANISPSSWVLARNAGPLLMHFNLEACFHQEAWRLSGQWLKQDRFYYCFWLLLPLHFHASHLIRVGNLRIKRLHLQLLPGQELQ